jgi:XTP/dITP diphosphohydrolase
LFGHLIIKTRQIVLASGNAGKLVELQALLAPLQLQLLSQRQLGIADAEEPFHTFVENALHKARHASRLSNLPAVADDSGICVASLGGAPGVYSARYAARAGGVHVGASKLDIDLANNAHLLAQLRQSSPAEAFYYCVLVFVKHPDDPAPMIADATWHGELVVDARGEGGFGYDPHFYLPHLNKTVAQLSLEEKNSLSHRAQACRQLVSKLQAASV